MSIPVENELPTPSTVTSRMSGNAIDLLHHFGEPLDVGLRHRIEPFGPIENNG
jgi:hypothetical protein